MKIRMLSIKVANPPSFVLNVPSLSLRVNSIVCPNESMHFRKLKLVVLFGIFLLLIIIIIIVILFCLYFSINYY